MKTDIHQQTKLLNFAVLQLRESLLDVSPFLRNSVPGGARVAERIDAQLAALDYVTASVAALQGGSVIPGAGGAPDPAVVEAAARWNRRGRQTNDLAAA
jgi:hypothetical protein